MSRRRIFEAFRQTRRSGAEPGEWVSLAEAARVVRAALRDSDLDRMSRGLGESEESLLAFWAHHVAQMGVPVYGTRIMSSAREAIPEHMMLAGRIDSDATRLELGSQHSVNDFGALQVKRHDLAAAMARVGALEPPKA